MADVTGTPGSDIIFFQGQLTFLDVTLSNPYSGEIIDIEDNYNMNTKSYEGLSGFDTLFMTNVGDAFFSVDSIGRQMLFNIESIVAGDGGDIIILASPALVLGNIVVTGGAEADIIWSNAGNDTLFAGPGNDIVDGGPGNDNIDGESGNDILQGGAGNDQIKDGVGADILQGDAGNDILSFASDTVFAAGTLAYNFGSPGIAGSGEVVAVQGTNGSFDIFDGGTGFDILSMTPGNDTFFLDDSVHSFHPLGSPLRLIDVERIDAAGGNDVIDLTSTSYSYGDIMIYGGDGNDRLWSSVGNDLLDGGTGDDSLWGGIGRDIMYGGAGNDILIGGPNENSGAIETTTQSHHFTNNVTFPNVTEMVSIMSLVPPGNNALGIAAGDLSVDFGTTAQISFVKTEAGYSNTLGFYNIGLDGTIQSATIAFETVKTYHPGDAATINLPGAPDTDFGFFIISDGFTKNNGYNAVDLDHGTLNFIYKYNTGQERLAKITDDGSSVSLVYDDGHGHETKLKGDMYHTTLRDGSTGLNADHATHVVSGVINNGDDSRLRIGFEDLKNLGDADYNDVVFDVSVASKSTQRLVVSDDDVLYGDAGNDSLDGGVGDDVLNGGAGADILRGGYGIDTFVFDLLDGMADTVKDFHGGAGGDVLDVASLLQGYDPLTRLLSDFVALTQSGSNTELRINALGQSGGAFVLAAIIEGGTGGATLADLITNGNIVGLREGV